MKKNIYTIILIFLCIFVFSQSKTPEIINISAERLAKMSIVNELVTSIPNDANVVSTQYVFGGSGKLGSAEIKGKELYSLIKSNSLITKKGNFIYMTIKYFKDKRAFVKECKIFIE